jgi:ribosomal protein S18 acetylase RimI-like enzyme
MQIINCTPGDIKTIFELYDKASEYQKLVFHRHWQPFDPLLIKQEIEEDRLWKIMVDGSIACLFTVAYSDPLIWGQRDREPALYIHRIVTNPLFRGQGYVKIIVEWAKAFGRSIGKKYLRMDTWGDNQKLIDYYMKFGFAFVDIITPTNTDVLPKHYEGITLCLLEIELEQQRSEARE